MKMKKLVSAFLSLAMCLPLTLSTVYAYESDINKPENKEVNVSSEEGQVLLSKNMITGEVEEWTFTSPSAQLDSNSEDNRYLPPTYPTDAAYEDNISVMPMTVGFPDLRVRLTVSDINTGVGLLFCEFDYDCDGTVDYVSQVTASVQLHDIIISCAHAVWKKYMSMNPVMDGQQTLYFMRPRMVMVFTEKKQRS